MTHLVPIREYTDPAQMLAGYAAHKQRMSALFSAGYKEPEPKKAAEVVVKTKPSEPPPKIRSGGIHWTQEETSLLRALQAERKNAREIAAEMGRSVASVTGKAWSLDLTLEPVPKPQPLGKRRRDWLRLAIVDEEPKRAPKQIILSAVCEVTGYSADEIRGIRRDASTVIARHIAFLMFKRHTQFSLPQIGRYLGDRDHTTVLHGAASIQHKAALDLDLAHQIASVTSLINSRAPDPISDVPPLSLEAA
jgi:hypothetical protein